MGGAVFDVSFQNSPSPSLSCEVVSMGRRRQDMPQQSISRVLQRILRLTKREKASLNSETCSSVRESACCCVRKSVI